MNIMKLFKTKLSKKRQNEIAVELDNTTNTFVLFGTIAFVITNLYLIATFVA